MDQYTRENALKSDSKLIDKKIADAFLSIRDELLNEARNSPGLLADLANLEQYVAETYFSRSFIELLQNADDAGAKRFFVMRKGSYLICANDGIPFTRADFHSLCRSASSNKQRGKTIGYRGIGFKSIVGIAEQIHLMSGHLQATFSKTLTKKALTTEAPIPLVRIPHPLDLINTDETQPVIDRLVYEKYTTIFVLEGLEDSRVQDEFDQFDADCLIFLRNIGEVILSDYRQTQYRCERQVHSPKTTDIIIHGPDRLAEWRVAQFESCSIAFSMVDQEIVPLNASAAVVHAFLPTLETTGLGVRVNANFSTDPSRTRIVFDKATKVCIANAADVLAEKISDLLLAPTIDIKHFSALIPVIDLAMLPLQKRSFQTEIISSIKTRLNKLKDKIYLAPRWLNIADAKTLANESAFIISFDNAIETTQWAFLRYIGIQTLSIADMLAAAQDIDFSVRGYAEIVSQYTKTVPARDLRKALDLSIWRSSKHNRAVTLPTIIKDACALAPDFVAEIAHLGVSIKQLGRIFSSVGVTETQISTLLPEFDHSTYSPELSLPTFADNNKLMSLNSDLLPVGQQIAVHSSPITSQTLPAWRGAEQYVAKVLDDQGYRVDDRSRQNLGYDLYAQKGENKHYVEVKLLDYAGQPFILTTNEEAVARETGIAYLIALVLRSKYHVYIQFIPDPTRSLSFVRQCRQWVWECSSYEFAPQTNTAEP